MDRRVERVTIQGAPRIDARSTPRVSAKAVAAPTTRAFPRLLTVLPIASSFLTSWSRFFPDSTLRQHAPVPAAKNQGSRAQPARQATRPPPRLVEGDLLPSLEFTAAWSAFSS